MLDVMKSELIFHYKWVDLLNDNFLKTLSIKKFITTYNQMKETLRKHYYDISLPISRLTSIYVNLQSQEEVKTDFNPFSKEDSIIEVTGQLDVICCSCLIESIKDSKVPGWLNDLFNYDEIKHKADPLPRSSNRYFITNGAFFIDPFFDKDYLYCPMAIFEKSRLENNLKDNKLKIYSSESVFLFTVVLDNKIQKELGLYTYADKYSTTLGNFRLKIVR